MPSLLTLRVNTGMAGKYSDAAQELANTVRQARPCKFWLVPRVLEKSTPVADLIQETVADLGSFAPWSQLVGRRPRRAGGLVIPVLESPVANR